jgi:hypothetical protein
MYSDGSMLWDCRYVTPTYEQAYRRLTGGELEYWRDGTSFVTHSMMVYRPYMDELLRTFNDGEDGEGWIFKIIDVLDTRDVQRVRSALVVGVGSCARHPVRRR